MTVESIVDSTISYLIYSIMGSTDTYVSKA